MEDKKDIFVWLKKTRLCYSLRMSLTDNITESISAGIVDSKRWEKLTGIHDFEGTIFLGIIVKSREYKDKEK